MIAGGGVDQLRRDPHLLLRSLHSPFQHIAHTHLPTHILDLHRLAFVGERRIARDDKETGDLGEVAGQDFGQAVTEVVLAGIAAHVVEGQDND